MYFLRTFFIAITCVFSVMAIEPAHLISSDGTHYNAGSFHAIVGARTTPDMISSASKFKKWWQSECDDFMQNKYEPLEALAIMIEAQRDIIAQKFSAWIQTIDMCAYDDLPDDIVSEASRPWQKFCAFIAIRYYFTQLEVLLPRCKKFDADCIKKLKQCEDDKVRDCVELLNAFPQRFMPSCMRVPLVVIDQMLRYTPLIPVVVFCEKMLFSISTFLAGAAQGHVPFPATKDFTNCHIWHAHKNEVVGLENLFFAHDVAAHGAAIVVGEHTGYARHNLVGQSFLQNRTVQSIRYLEALLENPHEHITIVRQYSPDQCISLVLSQMAIFYNELHEAPAHVAGRDIGILPKTADGDFWDLCIQLFAADPRGMGSNDEMCVLGMLNSTPWTMQTKSLEQCTKNCLWSWGAKPLGFSPSCAPSCVYTMCYTIKEDCIKKQHTLAYCSNVRQDLPRRFVPIHLEIYCLLIGGTLARILHVSGKKVCIGFPTRQAVDAIQEPWEAQITLQSLRVMLLDLERYWSSVLLVKKPELSITRPAQFLYAVLKHVNVQVPRTLTHSDGSASCVGAAMRARILSHRCNLQCLSSSARVQKFFEALPASIGAPRSADEVFKYIWQKNQQYIKNRIPALPRLCQKGLYEQLPILDPAIQSLRGLQKCLSLIKVIAILRDYDAMPPMTEEMIETLGQLYPALSQQMQNIALLKKFPQEFLTSDIEASLFLVHHTMQYTRFKVGLFFSQYGDLSTAETLSIISGGVLPITFPMLYKGCQHFSSHNRRYCNIDGVVIQRNILGYFAGWSLSEQMGQSLFACYTHHTFLQKWTKALITELVEGVQEASHGKSCPERYATSFALSQLTVLHHCICDSTGVYPFENIGIPCAFNSDDNFKVLCQSIWKDDLRQKSALWSLSSALTSTPFPMSPLTAAQLHKNCEREWLHAPCPIFCCNLSTFREIVLAAYNTIPASDPIVNANDLFPENETHQIQCAMIKSPLFLPIKHRDSVITVTTPDRETALNIQTEFEARVLLYSGVLTARCIEKDILSDELTTLEDFLQTLVCELKNTLSIVYMR